MRKAPVSPALSLLALLALSAAGPGAAAETSLPPSRVKAQMLLNFPLVIEWPEAYRDLQGRHRFCTLGPGGKVAGQIKQLLMSELGSRNLLYPDMARQDLSHCEILYVPSREAEDFRHLRSRLHDLPILTVGEGEAFLRQGGMIAFVKRMKQLGVFSKETIGFQVNPSAISARGLVLDPMLLELADRIVEETP